jgi:SNF2 family DNA or RNA helicase
VTAFQGGEGDVFLISLKAGGSGLNLTAADYVIHMDPWWNPAVEDQASDRAHRMGQTRPVTIYRLVAKDTIEDKIVDLHAHKRDLASSLLEGGEVSGKMSVSDMMALIRETED